MSNREISKIYITIIIVSYNTAHLLDDLFSSIRIATQNISAQIIVVDNDSDDKSVDLIKNKYPEVQLIINDSNIGFGRANNLALPYISSNYVLLLNTDTIIDFDSIEKTLSYMDQNPQCGVLGVRLVGRDGVLQPSCRYFPTPWNIFLNKTGFKSIFKKVQMVDDMNWDHANVRACDWVTGCFYLTRKEVIDDVGLFDPRYFLYYEEVDHCKSVKEKGWQVHFYPGTSVVHIGGESAKSDGQLTEKGGQLEYLSIESEMIYFRKNHGILTVFLDVLLMIFSDFIQMIKCYVKLKKISCGGHYLNHIALVIKVLINTKIGRSPTR